MTLGANKTADAGLRFLLAGASVVVIIAGLRAATPIILPFLIAVFLAIVNVPLMNWLVRQRVPKLVAVALTVLMAVSIVGGLVALMAASLNQFSVVAPTYQAQFQQLAVFIVGIADRYGLPADQWTSVIAPSGLFDLMGGVVGNTLSAVGGFLSNSFLVLLTVVFILFEAAGFGAKLKAAFGGDRDPFSPIARMISQVQSYLVAKTAISATTGLVIGTWVAVMGLDFPLLWGVLAFMFNFIPTLGSILAAIPAVVLAVIQPDLGPIAAAVIAGGYLAVNLVFGSFLEPMLMGRHLGLSTLVVFMSLVFWGWVWGPVGMLFSVPLTMAVKIALENTNEFRWVAVMLEAHPSVSHDV